MSWTDERVDLLKKLWSEGLSASQIAGRLGGVTRNAVIGKVHRLGLSGRVSAPSGTVKRQGPRITTPRRVMKPKFTTVGNLALRALYQPDAEPYTPQCEEIEIPLAERKSLLDLTESSCRWPIGDPQTAEFHFCNRNKVSGLPYCEAHARRAFQPPQPRRREREDAVRMVAPAPAPEASKQPIEV